MRKVRIDFGALTRVQYSEVIEVPDDADDSYIGEKADEIYGNLDGGEFTDDPDFWERGETTWEEETEEGAAGYLVYELCLPGYPDDAGEGKDGVIWAVLGDAQHETIERLAKHLSARLAHVGLDVGVAGVDYDGRDVSQMNQLVARLVKEIDEKED